MKKIDTPQKLRGSYSTPYKIAESLASWAIRSADDRILEPSCGDGVFVDVASRRLNALGAKTNAIPNLIVGIENDFEDTQKSKEKLRSILFSLSKQEIANSKSNQLTLPQIGSLSSVIINADFFDFYNQHKSQKFDVVLGNPPFIRYQNWKDEARELASEIMQNAGLRPNRLTNAWVPFVLTSSLMLSSNGRLAMVLPAEILQVKYAAQLRLFLTNYFKAITVLTFRKLVFPEIQQEVVLLLAERDAGHGNGMALFELEDEKDLFNFQPFDLKSNFKPVEHSQDKWTQYFLTTDEILFLRKIRQHPQLKTLKDVASVDVGVVTGENQFFIVDNDALNKFNLSRDVLPVVGGSIYLKGATFNTDDWEKMKKLGVRCHLLALAEESIPLANKGLIEYLRYGEERKVNTGYKCRIRQFWYSVPSLWVPDAFLFRQINLNPRMVLNETNATVTDTIHRVKFKEGVDARAAVVCFHNSLTFAFSEVFGRSYGGGVLELEPNEAEELPIPYFDIKSLFKEADRCLRENAFSDVLDMLDEVILKKEMGLAETQIRTLREIWQKLSVRRTQRKRASKLKPILQTIEVGNFQKDHYR
jgi:adenine-specific DNA-methyltransferase